MKLKNNKKFCWLCLVNKEEVSILIKLMFESLGSWISLWCHCWRHEFGWKEAMCRGGSQAKCIRFLFLLLFCKFGISVFELLLIILFYVSFYHFYFFFNFILSGEMTYGFWILCNTLNIIKLINKFILVQSF